MNSSIASAASGPSRPEQRAAPAVDADQARVEIERRERRARAPSRDARVRRREARLAASPSASRERSRAARREPQQRVVVEADQRRFEHGGEREIVVLAQRGAPRRDEVHDRDMIVAGSTDPRRRRGCPRAATRASSPRTSAPRERTRIMMSPARMRRGSPVSTVDRRAPPIRGESHPIDDPGDALGERDRGVVAASPRRAACASPRARAPARGAIGAQISTRPGRSS